MRNSIISCSPAIMLPDDESSIRGNIAASGAISQMLDLN